MLDMFHNFASLEREIEETMEKEIAGRLFVSKKVTRSLPNPEGKYITTVSYRGAQGDCGCTVAVSDLFLCQCCSQVKCRLHVRTASCCGQVTCVSCLVPVDVDVPIPKARLITPDGATDGSQPVLVQTRVFLVCKKCDEEMHPKLMKKAWNWFLGK